MHGRIGWPLVKNISAYSSINVSRGHEIAVVSGGSESLNMRGNFGANAHYPKNRHHYNYRSMHPAFLDSAPHRKSRQVLVGLRHEQLHKCNLHPHKNPTHFNYVDTQYLLLYKQGCYGPLPHDQASRDPRGVATGQARGTKYCYLSSMFKKSPPYVTATVSCSLF